MLPIYLGCAIIAGGFTLFSALASAAGAEPGSGHDAEFDHSADMDHGADHGGDHDADHTGDGHAGIGGMDFIAAWLPFSKLRFWLYTVAFFGIAGSSLTLSRMSAEPITLQASLGIGFVCGWVVNFIYVMFQRHLGGGSVGQDDFLGVQGRMLVGARPNQLGKVRVTVKGELIDLIAISDDGTEIAQDERVLVVTIENDKARVVRAGEFFSE